MLKELTKIFLNVNNFRVYKLYTKPYPCYYDERLKNFHYCTCIFKCKYREPGEYTANLKGCKL